MFRQKSFQDEGKGRLYIVGTPIGNLEDMTFRAIDTLKSVDLIAAEDTRQTQKLLNHFGIQTPMVSYHEHSRKEREDQILAWLREGKAIALVSDAGMPGISDPGQELVARCVAEEIPVIPIPGVNAAISGLVASGLPTDRFVFYGFLPRDSKERVKVLEELKHRPETLIFYEAPHRLRSMLADLHRVLGNRRAVLAREITKRFEEWVRGTLEEIIHLYDAEEPRGEYTLVVQGGDPETDRASQTAWWASLGLAEHVEHWIQQGLSSKDAIKKVAEERGLSRRLVYNAYHQERNQ